METAQTVLSCIAGATALATLLLARELRRQRRQITELHTQLVATRVDTLYQNAASQGAALAGPAPPLALVDAAAPSCERLRSVSPPPLRRRLAQRTLVAYRVPALIALGVSLIAVVALTSATGAATPTRPNTTTACPD
ncbi:hypothetical protein [Streptomyces sulphureus]|uniref:hypothetical protein n=1 Tax=Streptomyces sulphureus TaxID=47758 RepID=UPI00035F3ED7|nr:hypothetical protein [Streptomyces sulphureus]